MDEIPFEDFMVYRDDGQPLKFTGQLIGRVSSRHGTQPRWTELSLYRTRGGSYVAESVGQTIHEGEIVRRKAEPCETAAQVFDVLGHGWLAQKLYRIAHLDNSTQVE